ncbi:Fis family transcriptional regulator [Mesobacillus subterraneus]|uniref:sigma factor-like helix-turn-helix DNA-binding protein n=1 Tax=Mesobacillus subterraneus TaxID=285983 RepID=UPI00203B7C04|nr:sigma factor-like helix-turn-helix DNA-binding protein [Mesobacillus subterraneus]MCM3665523.1 Fis family transcriptional regulator [Mesobacillus subterraneus]MCM3686082.1 Fis family transcriptional regulator [Mesobacillus subterraneus]
MQALIEEYKQALKSIRLLQQSASVEDNKLLGGMASDLQYALEWMQTGRRPGNKRGIERRAAYERERPFDPLLMQRYFRSMDDNVYSWDDHKKESTLSAYDRELIADALSTLTEREREIYLMSRGYCFPESHIAYMLNVHIGTVRKTISRAEDKIKIQKNQSLFCLYA